MHLKVRMANEKVHFHMSVLLSFYLPNAATIANGVNTLSELMPEWFHHLDRCENQKAHRLGKARDLRKAESINETSDAIYMYKESEEVILSGFSVWPNYAYINSKGKKPQIYALSNLSSIDAIITRIVDNDSLQKKMVCDYGFIRSWSESILSASNFALSTYRAESVKDALNPPANEWHRRFMFDDPCTWKTRIRGVFPINILTKNHTCGHGEIVNLIKQSRSFGRLIDLDRHVIWLPEIDYIGDISEVLKAYILN